MRTIRPIAMLSGKAMLASAIALGTASSSILIPSSHAAELPSVSTTLNNMLRSAANRLSTDERYASLDSTSRANYASQIRSLTCDADSPTAIKDCTTKINVILARAYATATLSEQIAPAKKRVSAMVYLTDMQRSQYLTQLSQAVTANAGDQIFSDSTNAEVNEALAATNTPSVANIVSDAAAANLAAAKTTASSYIQSYGSLNREQRNSAINDINNATDTDTVVLTFLTTSRQAVEATTSLTTSTQAGLVALINSESTAALLESPNYNVITSIGDEVTEVVPTTISGYSSINQNDNTTPLESVEGESTSKAPAWLWYVLGIGGVGILGAILSTFANNALPR
ncbi:MAG: hypothetical protein Q3972_03615 [Corynebacterium sp.]|nr:hypothetical protein [Corynebacterium sp.]